MSLQHTTCNLLGQLIKLIDRLETHQYAQLFTILQNNSIGKHMRHIIEFYLCLLQGYESGNVNYDQRKRNKNIEEDKTCAIAYLEACIEQIKSLQKLDTPFVLQVSLSEEGNTIDVATNLARELAYNIEHTIHHMAIIKIALKTCLTNVFVEDHFGIAFSTIQYQDQQVKKLKKETSFS